MWVDWMIPLLPVLLVVSLGWLQGSRWPSSQGCRLVLAPGGSSAKAADALIFLHVSLSVRLLGFSHSMVARFQEAFHSGT